MPRTGTAATGYSSLSSSLSTSPVFSTIFASLRNEREALKKGGPGLIFHSDQGAQYASEFYRDKLKLLGITQSMSRSGNCYENAYAETFFTH
jgi:transposase InsO family protein